MKSDHLHKMVRVGDVRAQLERNEDGDDHGDYAVEAFDRAASQVAGRGGRPATGLVDENQRLRRRVAALEERLRRAGKEAGDLMAELAMTQQHLEATAEDRARIIARNQALEALIGGS